VASEGSSAAVRRATPRRSWRRMGAGMAHPGSDERRSARRTSWPCLQPRCRSRSWSRIGDMSR
jgi:hypothetical protein